MRKSHRHVVEGLSQLCSALMELWPDLWTLNKKHILNTPDGITPKSLKEISAYNEGSLNGHWLKTTLKVCAIR